MNNEILVQRDGELKVDREYKVITDACGRSFSLEPTDVVLIDGERYRMVDRKPEVGEKVIIIAHKMLSENHYGKICTVVGLDSNLVDTDGKWDDGSTLNLTQKEYRVLEPVAQSPGWPPLTEEADPKQSLEDLIANLARRVSSLEQQLTDSQRNIERQAEELAALKHEEDIRTLDERTQPNTKTVEIAEPHDNKEPVLVFVQRKIGSDFSVYQDGKEVHGIRSITIRGGYDEATTHEIEYLTGGTKR